MTKPMDPHQREAVDAVLRALEVRPGTAVPERGLRTQVIMATGSGKTLVATRSAEELRAGRVLVLVPSLDLLAQTAAAWRAGGRRGPRIGVSSLRAAEAAFPNTTDPDELAEWTRHLDKATVFATYASLGLGTLERAHAAGMPAWDLIVVDEAHRTSGLIGKPWAVVHDNRRIPAARRLYMTATPRLWQLEEGQGAPVELVAGMEDDPDGPFGSRCFTLTLSEAIERGVCAPYRVVCVDVSDPGFQAAVLLGADGRSAPVRGARLMALQTALMKTASEQRLRRTLVFHHQVKEAEAFAAGLPDVARRLRRAGPGRYPATIRADWLCGDHPPLHRRRLLAEFADGTTADGTPVDASFLSSVKVLGEGVDTRTCDSVYFCDVRGSMPDLVQAVGRALRMRPGEGKVATLVVPVLLGPGETPENMLTSKAYGGLAKLLEALRAHDARVVEQLAQPQAPSPYRPAPQGPAGPSAGTGEAAGVSGPARELLRFSTPRDPALLAAFIRLRVIDPEDAHWKRGIEAAVRYLRDHQDLRVPFTYRVPESHGTAPTPEGGTRERVVSPGSPAGFPLGQWIADIRRAYAAGRLDDDRVDQLDRLGMVWSHVDVAWEEGLAAARGWAAEHGHHLLAPADATHQGYRVGIFLKNARAAARRADRIEQRRAEGLPVAHEHGALSRERRDMLEEIDPSWCPAWSVDWQRAFHLARRHLQEGGTLPTEPGTLTRHGEDLGRWVRAQRQRWDGLGSGRQWMLRTVLGIEPADDAVEQPAARTTHTDRWNLNLAAATQYYEREGHLQVPRKHVETVTLPAGDDGSREERPVRLGTWISNQRSRADALSPQRVEQLTALGMRWS
ncbi:helicase associated domain-containing protein [Streptomyces tirandamycinicus]|uniref:DEAD/DEAH box helicase n=1 Tax=Streptomyces tirandamycinicus TaxID=2174846 RepID=UPI002271B4DE|nr:DEAD/DEAH box helicase [Streptomyces tirandamycinicus]MCY0984892.1 Helicase associated domain protein [Streptomyces tirandamycinicus]